MMQKFKTVERPADTKEIFDRLVCDICNRESVDGDNWHAEAKSHFYKNEYDETKIELKTQTKTTVDFNRKQMTYCDGDVDYESVIFDICPDCFTGKIVPFLESLGAKPRYNRHNR